jgi:hypothetical protein
MGLSSKPEIYFWADFELIENGARYQGFKLLAVKFISGLN